MEPCGAVHPAGQARRQQAHGERARGGQRPDVHPQHRPARPKDLGPASTVHGYFELWTWDGTLDPIHDALYVKCREQAGREASPTAAIIDSQSVKSAEKGGPRSKI